MAPENILTFTQRTTETEAWNSLKADVATKIKKILIFAMHMSTLIT